jgi:hypothetical protein
MLFQIQNNSNCLNLSYPFSSEISTRFTWTTHSSSVDTIFPPGKKKVLNFETKGKNSLHKFLFFKLKPIIPNSFENQN